MANTPDTKAGDSGSQPGGITIDATRNLEVIVFLLLPTRINGRFTRDNETNTDVLTPLYNLKLGVSASFIY